MKCIKILTGLYIAVVLSAIVTLIACSKNRDIGYLFDISKPDYSSELSADSIDLLFHKGITVKNYKSKDYYIRNSFDLKDSTINGYEILDFGPVTFSSGDNGANYKFWRQDSLGETRCLLELPLISKFKGKLKKVELEPAWLKFSLYDGLYSVNLLPSITVNFDNKLIEGEKFMVQIPWIIAGCKQNMPILVSVRINCYVTEDEYFSEVINLSFSENDK